MKNTQQPDNPYAKIIAELKKLPGRSLKVSEMLRLGGYLLHLAIQQGAFTRVSDAGLRLNIDPHIENKHYAFAFTAAVRYLSDMENRPDLSNIKKRPGPCLTDWATGCVPYRSWTKTAIFFLIAVLEAEAAACDGPGQPATAKSTGRKKIIIENGSGPGQFNNAKGIRIIKSAYEKPGTPQSISKNSWSKLKKMLEEKNSELLSLIKYQTEYISISPENVGLYELVFVGFEK